MTDASPDVSERSTLEGSLASEFGETATLEQRSSSRSRDEVPRLSRLGHCVLLGPVGQGGMGTVYGAYDEKLDRKVAVKLLRSIGGTNGQLRLVREAQAMARLSHPNVVQIYEIGETQDPSRAAEPLTFIVMEFVDGCTLDHWLDQSTRSMAEILGVFAQAGRGLVAAHAAGLVHRDFKPKNVMVRRDDGRVLVTDFGLARIGVDGESLRMFGSSGDQVPAELTATGTLLGTPAYMSPEQFRGLPSDARSDQFSFCVALWEALHGQRPFSGASFEELSQAVISGQTTTPARSDVPAWLRKVLARGLAREPSERWPSMSALLAAIGQDPTRRRRVAFASVAMLALLGLGMGGLALRQSEREAVIVDQCARDGRALETEWNADVKNDLRAAFIKTGVDAADSSWERTEARVDAHARDWGELRERICVEARVEHSRDPASLARIEQCLDQQRATFGGMLEGWAEVSDSTVRSAIASAASLIPPSNCLEEAAQVVSTPMSIQTGSSWIERISTLPEQREVAKLRGQLQRADGLMAVGRYEPALEQAKHVLAEAETLELLALVAEARFTVGDAQRQLGDYEAARESLSRAYMEAERGRHDVVVLDVASLLTFVIGDHLGDHDLGLFWGELGQAYIARLGLGESLRATSLLNNLGNVHFRRNAFDEAQAAYDEALRVTVAVLGPDHLDVAYPLANLGNLAFTREDHEAALTNYRRALAIREAALGPEHPLVASMIGNMAAVQWERGEFEEALAGFERAHDIFVRALGPEHANVALMLMNMSSVLQDLRRYDRAQVVLEQSLVLLEARLGPTHTDVAQALAMLGTLSIARGDPAAALARFEQALKIAQASVAPEHTLTAMIYTNIGDAQYQLGRYQEAIESSQRGQHAWETTVGAENSSIAFNFHVIGGALTGLGRAEEGFEFHERALAIREAALGPEHPMVATSLIHVGTAARELGRLDRARAALQRALTILDVIDAPLDEHAEVRFELARTLWADQQLDDARTQAQAARDAYARVGVDAEPARVEVETWLREHA